MRGAPQQSAASVTEFFSLAETTVYASSNRLRSAAGNLQAPHGSLSATVSPPDADGGESYVIANSGRLPQSKLSSRLAASMQYVRASTQAFQLILLTEATATEAKLPERNEVETWPTHRSLF